MAKTILWIDDSAEERRIGQTVLEGIAGVSPRVAGSSEEARNLLEQGGIDAVVTDILRRRPDGSIAGDDGYTFFQQFIRPQFPEMPVVFHTKNLPSSFTIDRHAQYLSKWEPTARKTIELDARLGDAVALYEAYADWATWSQIEPRLVKLQSEVLNRLRDVEDIWQLTAEQFEQLVGELLERINFSVLWIPGGKDGGVDIIASSDSRDFLIDVKRYKTAQPVTVELVRRVYGVAESIASTRTERIIHGGIITSSRFTADAQLYRDSLRRRPLLCDGGWLKSELAKYVPRLAPGASLAPGP
jgi:CheY-like chemotaxis protein